LILFHLVIKIIRKVWRCRI